MVMVFFVNAISSLLGIYPGHSLTVYCGHHHMLVLDRFRLFTDLEVVELNTRELLLEAELRTL